MLKTVWATTDFWVGVCERGVKTFAQSLIASIGATQVAFGDVDWGLALSVAGVSALVSVLTSLVDSEPVVATTKINIFPTLLKPSRSLGGSEEPIGSHAIDVYLPRHMNYELRDTKHDTDTEREGSVDE